LAKYFGETSQHLFFDQCGFDGEVVGAGEVDLDGFDAGGELEDGDEVRDGVRSLGLGLGVRIGGRGGGGCPICVGVEEGCYVGDEGVGCER